MMPKKYLLLCQDGEKTDTMFCENMDQVTEYAPEFAKDCEVAKVYVYEFFDIGRVGFTLQHHRNFANGTHPTRNNKRWTSSEDQTLVDHFKRGSSYRDIAAELHRTSKAVKVRLDILRRKGAHL